MIRPTPAEDRSFGLTVGTLSPGTVLSCSPATPLAQAVTKMRNANSSSIIVVQSNKPVGILTEHDLLSLPANSKAVLSQPVEMRMSHPVHTISIHASPQSAIVRMRERNVRHLVTVDENDCLVGIISRTDLIRQISNKKPFSANDVADAVRRSTIFVDARMPVSELRHRMHGEKCDSAIVTGFPADLPVDQQTGIITERDILRGFADDNDGLTAGDIATRPVMVINGDVNLNDARTIMLRKNIRHLVVHNQHREIIGVLSFADLLEFIEQDYLIYLNNINDDSDSELVKARQSLALDRKSVV